MCACVCVCVCGGGGGFRVSPKSATSKFAEKDKKYKTLFQNCSSNFLFQLITSA